jgi:hypothetical protein
MTLHQRTAKRAEGEMKGKKVGMYLQEREGGIRGGDGKQGEAKSKSEGRDSYTEVKEDVKMIRRVQCSHLV